MVSKWFRMGAVLASVASLGIIGAAVVQANHLPPPENVVCTSDGTALTVTWDAVVDANHYGVEFTATYPDGSVQEVDGSVKNATTLSLALADLAVDTDGDLVADTSPTAVDVSVKSLHPGKDQGRQNSVKSAPVSCTL